MNEKEAFLREVLMVPRMAGRVPVLSLFHGGDYYYMRDFIYWEPEREHQERFQRVDVPTGFVTDLTSIPSVFWSILPRDGAYLHPAIVHDFAYWTQTRTRDQADEVLRIAMLELKVPKVTVAAIYAAVRTPIVGGAAAWAKNKELRAAGERRVLKRFPDLPETTWEEWKSQADVFSD